MRAILAVLAVIVLAGIGYWALQGSSAPIAPPTGTAENETEAPHKPATPAQAERARVATPPNSEPNAEAKVAPDEPRNTEPDEPVQAANVVLTVRNVVTREPIEGFRWRFVQPRSLERDTSETSVAELTLTPRAIGDLLVEADGMQPFTKKQFAVPAGNEPTHLVDVFLTPSATAAGITLMVKRLDNQPVTHVRVDAYEINASNRDTAWQLGQPLWARRTTAEDGIYQLPPLPAGEYGILLVAVNEEGALLPLKPFRRSFVLNGSNGFLEDVPLEEACALQLELLETNNQPFDPKVHGNVTISLNPVGQTGLQRKWTTQKKPDANGKSSGTVSEANRVPGPGLIWLDEPVAPGNYLLEIFINGDPRVSQALLLRGNERQLERVYVR